ncbi:uncharacterized protein LOC109256341 isoform X2 [Panthera pardus]|uniref:Uncharacterized protein LOC109256341 isoform X2 n=1 Tax=Panthera pardus TaxID=9691 RepID=A0A9W2W2D4_PANPR|nr:uncharacterized protein LOC109256341 isoform X2 [Panthera pardus]
MRVAGRNNSFPRPFFLPQGEQQEKERARRAEFLNGRTDATSPSPGRTPAPREAGSRERGSRAGGRGHRAASPPPRSRGWASGSSGLGPVSSSSWATTLAFRGLRRRTGGLRKLAGGGLTPCRTRISGERGQRLGGTWGFSPGAGGCSSPSRPLSSIPGPEPRPAPRTAPGRKHHDLAYSVLQGPSQCLNETCSAEVPVL